MIQIKIYSYDSPEYQQELQLRDEVLRRPLGMSLKNDNLENDLVSVHVGAFDKASCELLGVLLLTPLENGRIKMRQVAVLQNQQRRGIGRCLVTFAEKYAFENGYAEIVLHAREVAMGFYTQLGYETVGDEFLEVNIPHYKMRKWLLA